MKKCDKCGVELTDDNRCNCGPTCDSCLDCCGSKEKEAGSCCSGH